MAQQEALLAAQGPLYSRGNGGAVSIIYCSTSDTLATDWPMIANEGCITVGDMLTRVSRLSQGTRAACDLLCEHTVVSQ